MPTLKLTEPQAAAIRSALDYALISQEWVEADWRQADVARRLLERMRVLSGGRQQVPGGNSNAAPRNGQAAGARVNKSRVETYRRSEPQKVADANE